MVLTLTVLDSNTFSGAHDGDSRNVHVRRAGRPAPSTSARSTKLTPQLGLITVENPPSAPTATGCPLAVNVVTPATLFTEPVSVSGAPGAAFTKPPSIGLEHVIVGPRPCTCNWTAAVMVSPFWSTL